MIKLTVNGKRRKLNVDPDTPLLWVLRDNLELTGTRFGCGIGACGCCTVHLDGEPIRSCVTVLRSVQSRRVTTIEGLSHRGDHPIQTAWRRSIVPQCGYCQSGQIMQAAALLRRHPHPDDKQIDAAMAGNLCRCGTYTRIRKAIHLAAGNIKSD